MKWLINHLTLTTVMVLIISALYCAAPSESQKTEPLLNEIPAATITVDTIIDTQNITRSTNLQKPSLVLFVSSG